MLSRLTTIKESQRQQQVYVSLLTTYNRSLFFNIHTLIFACYKELSKRKVICPNTKGTTILKHKAPFTLTSLITGGEGCQWKGPWGDLVNHLSECEHVATKCPFCFALVPRGELDEHKQFCGYCKEPLCSNLLEVSLRQRHCRSRHRRSLSLLSSSSLLLSSNVFG